MSEITIPILAAKLQDMWHYAALIKPPADGRVSTFDGSGYYEGLQGKLRAYEGLRNNVISLQYNDFTEFDECNLLPVEAIKNEVQLVEQTGYAIHAINVTAQKNCINAYSCEWTQKDSD